jgi:hypothetical protein
MPALASLLRRSSALLLAAPLALGLAACNEAETGHNGVAYFVPDDCGRDFCTFDDPIAAGSTLDVYLDGVDDQYVDDLEIASTDRQVIDVLGEEPSGSPRYTLLARAPGRADLAALDPRGDEVDFISVEVARVDELRVDVEGRNLGPPLQWVTADGTIALGYTVDAGAHLEIDVEPYAHGRWAIGDFQYGVVIDPEVAAALDSSSRLTAGRLVLDAPAGEHDILLTAPGGAYVMIHLSAR